MVFPQDGQNPRKRKLAKTGSSGWLKLKNTRPQDLMA